MTQACTWPEQDAIRAVLFDYVDDYDIPFFNALCKAASEHRLEVQAERDELKKETEWLKAENKDFREALEFCSSEESDHMEMTIYANKMTKGQCIAKRSLQRADFLRKHKLGQPIESNQPND